MIPENAVAIRIIRVPEGEVPYPIRLAQVGIVLWPAVPRSAAWHGLLTGEEMPPREAFAVPTDVVATVLRQKDLAAHHFFGWLWQRGSRMLSYGADEVEIIG